MITRSKWVLLASAAAGMTCLAWAALFAAPLSESVQMHVKCIEIGNYSGHPSPLGRKQRWLGTKVTIQDQDNVPVPSASVSGTFTHHDGTVYVVSGKTDVNGVSFIKVKEGTADDCGPDREHSFDVTSVTKKRATYNPLANCITRFTGTCFSCGGCCPEE